MINRHTLNAEEIAALRNAAPILNVIRDGLARLKRVGIDTSELDARADQAEQIRSGMLREFTPALTPKAE